MKGWMVLLLSAGMAGCSGSGAGLDANGRPLTQGGGSSGALTADFDSIQSHVFTPICTVCHVGAAAPQGLRLDSANSYSLLVGVPSTEVPSIQRVKPGDPDNSYIIQRLEGHASVGAQMPLGGPYLSAEVIAVIRQWISDGALRPALPAAKVARAFGVVTVVPAAGESFADPPPQVVVEVSQDIDVTRLGRATLQIEGIGAAAAASAAAMADVAATTATAAVVVPAQISVPTANRRALILTPQLALPAGHYRVVLRPEPGYSLSSLGAESLTDGVVTEFDVEIQP